MSLQAQIDELVSQRASEWIEILRQGSVKDRLAFIEWVSESPRHLDAYLTMALLDEQIERIDLLSIFDQKELQAQLTPRISELRQARKRNETSPYSSQQFSSWRRYQATSLAIGLAIVAISIAGWIGLLSPWQTYSTGIGEQRSIELPDGSMAHMNAQSILEVRFDESRRDLRLKDGEALFKVAHDERRPFRVHTRDAVVQAIGTQFNVYARGFGTTVSVIEGRVSVAPLDALDKVVPESKNADTRAWDRPNTVGSGEAVSVTSSGDIVRKAAVNVSDAVAWRQRQLVFSQTPLEEVVAEINRHNRSTHIRIEGVHPRSRHYSGTFDADDPAALAAFLSRERDLRIERAGNEIIIRGAEAPTRERDNAP